MGRAATAGKETPGWLSGATFAAEAVLAALLAWTLAQLVWVAYPPLVTSVGGAGLFEAGPSPAPGLASAGAVNPFRRSAVAAPAAEQAADVPETTLNLKLFGVRSVNGEEGEAGTAIIQTPDNQQHVFHVGDSIVSGVTLAIIEPRRVVIVRDGVREAVLLSERPSLIGTVGAAPGTGEAAAAPAPAPPAAAASAGPELVRVESPVPAQALLQGLTATPGPAGGMIVRGDPSVLAAAGLQASDVLKSVNGVPLDSADALASALVGVGPGARVTVGAERAGRPLVIELVLQ